jgi:hypothetical protein
VQFSVPSLRAHFAEHNRRVVLLALLTLAVAAGLWYLAYAVLFWLTLLAASATCGMEAKPPEVLPALFIYSGSLLVLVTWIAHRIRPNDLPRDDKKPLDIAADFLLAIPRATLAIWGNLSAYHRLSSVELEYAAQLLQRLTIESRLPIYRLPLEIPDRAIRHRVVLGLQLVQLVELVHSRSGIFLSLSRRGAKALAASSGRPLRQGENLGQRGRSA